MYERTESTRTYLPIEDLGMSLTPFSTITPGESPTTAATKACAGRVPSEATVPDGEATPSMTSARFANLFCIWSSLIFSVSSYPFGRLTEFGERVKLS